MIRRIQTLNYRCLRHVDVELDGFHVAVGPNASGKSTLFDVIAFLGDLVGEGVDAAVKKRTGNFQDLVWDRPGEDLRFELAVEFDIPEDLRDRLPIENSHRFFRYEIAVEERDGELWIDAERGLLVPETPREERLPRPMFPKLASAPATILVGGGKRGSKTILSKSPKGRDNFNFEVSPKSGKGWTTSVSFGRHRSVLGNMPEDPDKFPVATYVKQALTEGIKSFFLEAERLRAPSPPSLQRNGFSFSTDGSNLPWAVRSLKEEYPNDYEEWMAHVRTALKELSDVSVIELESDRSGYLALHYETGVTVPSWVASDGTLRFLALTLLGYLPSRGVYLLEEPENGLHPFALDAIYDALWSSESQVLSATHSPAFLRLVAPEEALCFAKDRNGATDIVRGHHHPHLAQWKGKADMEILFATGVIG